MSRLCVLSAGVVFATLAAGSASAQPPVPGGGLGTRPPTYSPYLNLLRGGSPAINYYGLVRPEIQFRQGLQNLAGNVAQNAQDIGTLEAGVGGVSPTGHPTMFMNYGSYFMNGSAGANTMPRFGASSFNQPNFMLPRQPTIAGGMGGIPRR